MTKKLIVGLSIVGLLLASYYGLFWLQYYWALEKSNRETVRAKCEKGVEQGFSGTIDKINRYEYDEFMTKNFFALEIVTSDSLDRHKTYQFNLNEYNGVLDFSKIGQRIEKIRGNDTFTLTSDNGKSKRFTIPDCRLITE